MRGKFLLVTMWVVFVAGLIFGGGYVANYWRGEAGQLSIVVDGDTPISRILVGGERNAVIAKFRFSAKGEPFIVTQLRIRSFDRQSDPCVEAVKISYPRPDGQTEEKMVMPFHGFADFFYFNFYVPENKPVILTVSVDLWRIAAEGCSGSKITASLAFDFFETIGQKSNRKLIAHGGKKDDPLGSGATISAFPMIIHKTKPTLTLASGSPSGSDVPKTNQEVLRFTVAADQGGDLEISEVDFRLAISDQNSNGWNSASSLVSRLSLYEREDMTIPLGGKWTFVNTIGLDKALYANFVFSPRKTVSAGASKSFSLLMDTSNATRSSSQGDGDKMLAEIPAVANPGGFLLRGIVWNETGVGAAIEIDGANVQKLPVTGGVISY